jgi:YHS domain-containing protein
MILSLGLAYALAVAQEQAPKPAPQVNATGQEVQAAQVADNAICPVMGQKVGEKSSVVTVRGRAYRICCAPCGQKMEKNPDKYLEPDGTPKNAKKK